MNDEVMVKMGERYDEILRVTRLYEARTVTYRFVFTRDYFALLKLSHYWGGNANYETIATFYSTMSNKQIIDAINVIIGD